MAAACAQIPSPDRYTYLFQPSYTEFVSGALPLAASTCTSAGPTGQGVHTFLENQCGTLDCHGQVGRPFRIFSENGLRAANDAGLYSGYGALTDDEKYSNFLSAIGLQPELTSDVVLGDASPTSILLVQKPRALVRHKGGKKMVQGDPMDTCLTTWLADTSHYEDAQFDSTCCDEAAAVP
jgi:hypothetical protein